MDQAKNIIPNAYFGYLVVAIIVFLPFVGFATSLFLYCRYLCNRLCYGTHNQRHDGVDTRPYVLPIIDPTEAVQDHPADQHQLQVNLRPYNFPNMDSIAPSAPRLDLEDLPPSYEEAVKTTMSTQV